MRNAAVTVVLVALILGFAACSQGAGGGGMPGEVFQGTSIPNPTGDPPSDVIDKPADGNSGMFLRAGFSFKFAHSIRITPQGEWNATIDVGEQGVEPEVVEIAFEFQKNWSVASHANASVLQEMLCQKMGSECDAAAMTAGAFANYDEQAIVAVPLSGTSTPAVAYLHISCGTIARMSAPAEQVFLDTRVAAPGECMPARPPAPPPPDETEHTIATPYHDVTLSPLQP